jgi:hypothetical protein
VAIIAAISSEKLSLYDSQESKCKNSGKMGVAGDEVRHSKLDTSVDKIFHQTTKIEILRPKFSFEQTMLVN